MRAGRIAETDFREVQKAAFGVLHHMHEAPPQVQVAGIGWMFLLACERYGLNTGEVLGVVDRMIRHVRSVAPTYPGAIKDYMKHEWPD